MLNSFYKKLIEVLREQEGEFWTETVLRGERVGEKSLGIGSLAAEADEDVYREQVGTPQKLVICGAGHVSMALIRMGLILGFHVTAIDDRPKFADNARAAGASEVLCKPFREALETIDGDRDTWFIIVTRGHRYDSECLEQAIQKPHAYVGMMGSKRRVAIVKQQLEEKGISHELLEALYSPIGLKIQAQTPEEIAVSVMAEIVQVKNSRKRSRGYSKELVQALESCEGKMVVATIVSRKGSAPRDIGTKMFIGEDGKTVDTIGGGCVEGAIIQKALHMMRTDEPRFQLCRVDMTADMAEEEGMVCGGVVQVMLERADV